MYPAVYSYRRSPTRELELSIESLKNIEEWDGRVFVIGDEPNLQGDHTHIPIGHKWGKESGTRSNDEICAYLTAADFLDDFIIMADDIYILRPWSLKHHNRGSLDEHIKSRKGMDGYTRQLRATRDFLESNANNTLSYEMHIPFLANSEQLKDAAEIIRVTKPMFIRSILGNWFNIPSTKLEDPKRKPITNDTVLYSSEDRTFKYEKVKEYLK